MKRMNRFLLRYIDRVRPGWSAFLLLLRSARGRRIKRNEERAFFVDCIERGGGGGRPVVRHL